MVSRASHSVSDTQEEMTIGLLFPLSSVLHGSYQRAEFLIRTLSIFLILYENKYLDMEIPERTIYFNAKKKNLQNRKTKNLSKMAVILGSSVNISRRDS